MKYARFSSRTFSQLISFPSKSFRTSKWQTIDWMIVAVLVLASCILFLPALGSPGVLVSDAYYSSAAKEMLLRGDFITPYLNFKPFYEKPILIYWFIITSYKVFGINTFAARLPSALCAIASIASLFVLMRQFSSRRAAYFAAAIMACSPLFAVVGRLALTDMPLTFFTMLSNLFFLIVLIKKERQYLAPAYVSMALAILCKGPMAVFLVGSCVLGFLIISSVSKKDFFNRIVSLNPLLGAALLLIIDAPWFVIEHLVTQGDFTKYFFIQQNFGRISGQLPSHVYPFWFYFPFLLGGFFPWSVMICQSPLILRLRKMRFNKSARAGIMLASACWLIGTLVMLLAAGSKLPTYLLPISPPIAILVSAQLERIFRLSFKRLIIWTAPLMVLCTLACLVLSGNFLTHSNSLLPTVSIFTILLALGFIVYGVLLFKTQLHKAALVLIFCCLAATAFFTPIGMLEDYRHVSQGLHSLLVSVKKQGPASIAVLPKDVPAASFYSQEPVFELEMIPRDCFTFWSSTKSPHYVIVETEFLPLIQRSYTTNAETIAHVENWNLVLVKGLPIIKKNN